MDERRKAIAIPRRLDHLDTIETILRNLQGYSTLAYELVQNADDVPNTASISFDITPRSLVIDNDGVFSDCGEIEEPECPWREDPHRGYRCDFHRLCHLAGSDKRRQPGTTGKFGVGLIAVYQITDRPQVISNGRHWTIQEEFSEDERIQQCGGCAVCKSSKLPGTRLILPWADDPHSRLRRALNAGAVTLETRRAIVQEWESSLSNAMVFLKRLTRIEIRLNGKQARSFQRDSDNEQALVVDSKPGDAVVWTLLEGGFAEVAEQMRQRYPGLIETGRSSVVRIAIPDHQLTSGKLYACLPTQHATGLPFHIDADFFPGSDRKQVVLEEDYQSEWNRAAIESAAEALRDSVHLLPDMIGAERFWHLMLTSFKVFRNAAAQNQDRVFGQFWEKVKAVLSKSRTIWTERGEWKLPPLVPLLGSKEEEEAVPILDSLGIDVMHRSLRPYIFDLPWSVTLGMTQLGIKQVIDGLRSTGLTKRTDLSCCPVALQNRDGLILLWRQLTRLLSQKPGTASSDSEQELSNCAVALGRDNALWPCNQVYRADHETVDLFSRVSSEFPFLSDMGGDGEAVARLCPYFDSSAAVDLLSEQLSSDDSTARTYIEQHPDKLVRWFEARRDELLESPTLRQGLLDLPIYPGQGGALRSLNELALPGDFEDPVGITDVIDLKRLGNRKEFLMDLGKQPLTFQTYVRDHLPAALMNGSLSERKKRAAISLLASGLGKIKDDGQIRSILASLPIIEIRRRGQEGPALFAKPDQVYLPECGVEKILGSDTMIACLPKEKREAVSDLYRWLGVEDKPRFHDVQDRIISLTKLPPNNDSRTQIKKILLHLEEQYRAYQNKEPPASWQPLRTQEWLPVEGRSTKWYSPQSGIYSVFQRYLFESQGPFLDIDRTTQSGVAGFLKWLGVKDEPEPNLVVKHLIHCASQTLKVNNEVYVYLNRKSDHPAINELLGEECLLLPDGRYVAASKLFRTDHPFGKYRYRLSPDMSRYDQLLDHLGVLPAPRPEDAIEVLREIGAEWGHKPLDAEAYAICISCWHLLARELVDSPDDPDRMKALTGRVSALSDVEAVPNSSQHVLAKTKWLLFDDRTGIAAAFGRQLESNLVERHYGVWPAMSAAGVRTLSTAVDVQLLECDDPVDDERLCQLLKDRSTLIQRVLESRSRDSKRNGCIHILLDGLRCFRASNLVVRYDLHFERRIVSSEERALQALVRNHGSAVIYYVSHEGVIPWTAIAKELALVLEPDMDPGQTASGIKDVISAESESDAEGVLDELGFAPLSTSPLEPPDAGEPISAFGGDEDITCTEPSAAEGAEERQGEEHRPEHAPPLVDPSGQAAGAHGAPTAEPMTPGQKGLPTGKNITTGSKLRTYVQPADHDAGEEDPAITQRRKEVDAAGVKHTLDHESRVRFPVEMPHNHEGWDIESKDVEGNTVRYIEVKSTSGRWNDTGVPLSRPQFEKAKELRDQYWLYVVEYALEPDFVIHRIQDPAERVNQFLYDRGWQQLAEKD